MNSRRLSIKTSLILRIGLLMGATLFLNTTHGFYIETTARPPAGANAVTVFSHAGFDYKTCDQVRPEYCTKRDWIPAGTHLTVINVMHEPVNGKNETFLFVEYDKNGERRSGYVWLDHTTFFENDPVCKSCQNPSSVRNRIQELFQSIPIGQPRARVRLDRRWRYFSPLCYNFITQEGNVGAWGQKINEAIRKADARYVQETNRSCFHGDLDLSNVCPNYPKFNAAERELFWPYFFFAIAGREAYGCNPNSEGPGIHKYRRDVVNIADGLFGLEYDVKLRRYRDEEMCSANKKTNTKDIDFQVNCAVSILRDTQCAPNLPVAAGGGYWMELKYRDGDISRKIREFPLCTGLLR